MEIILGATVKDKLTEFSGIATGRCVYISGCSQVLVVPRVDKDGKRVEGHWFDEQRLVVDTSKPLIILENGTAPGFDMEAPKR